MLFLSTRPEKIRRRNYLFSLFSWADGCANRCPRLRPDNQYRINDLDWFLRSFESNFNGYFLHVDLLDHQVFLSCEVILGIIKDELPWFVKNFDEKNLGILQGHYKSLIWHFRRKYPREYLHYRLKTESRYLESNWKISNLHECEFN